MKIQAAVAWEAGATLSIEEFDLDEPRDDEILVKVEAVGVCHTDDNARLGRLPVVFPIILGHEGAGLVERTGRNVTKVKPGDRVLFTPDYCGNCEQCVLGHSPYCNQVVPVTFIGTRPDGSPRAHQNGKPVRASFGQRSFATHSLVTERNIVPVPGDAPLRYLASFTFGVRSAGRDPERDAGSQREQGGDLGHRRGRPRRGDGRQGVRRGGDRHARPGRSPARASRRARRDRHRRHQRPGPVRRGHRGGQADRPGRRRGPGRPGNPAVILAAVQSLATHGTASVITSSGAPVTLPPGDLLLKGRQLRGTMGGHINPTIFIPRLLDLHAQGRFPVDRWWELPVRPGQPGDRGLAVGGNHQARTLSLLRPSGNNESS